MPGILARLSEQYNLIQELLWCHAVGLQYLHFIMHPIKSKKWQDICVKCRLTPSNGREEPQQKMLKLNWNLHYSGWLVTHSAHNFYVNFQVRSMFLGIPQCFYRSVEPAYCTPKIGAQRCAPLVLGWQDEPSQSNQSMCARNRIHNHRVKARNRIFR